MKPKTEKFLNRLPKILTILFILFIAMFSLDVFDGNEGFWGTALALFMHNIPVFFMIAVLFFSWRNYLVGAIIFSSPWPAVYSRGTDKGSRFFCDQPHTGSFHYYRRMLVGWLEKT